MKIHHVGYLVKNIEASLPEFISLGYHIESRCANKIVYDALRKIDILFLTNGIYRIELVQPKGTDSIVAGMLQKLGSSPYHICYECDDIERVCSILRERGYVPASSIEPAAALDGKDVCFMFKQSVGMIELVEI